MNIKYVEVLTNEDRKIYFFNPESLVAADVHSGSEKSNILTVAQDGFQNQFTNFKNVLVEFNDGRSRAVCANDPETGDFKLV